LEGRSRQENLDNARLLRVVQKAIKTNESTVDGKATFEEERLTNFNWRLAFKIIG